MKELEILEADLVDENGDIVVEEVKGHCCMGHCACSIEKEVKKSSCGCSEEHKE